MMNLGAEPPPSTSATAEKAFSFISRGWREVRDSADADLQLIRARANSFKKLATSFDLELENFLNSASAFNVPGAVRWSPSASSSASQSPLAMVPASTSIAELEFVKKIQPKLSEFRQAYSSPDFSRKVLERWSPRARIRIDLSAIKNALVSQADDEGDVLDLDRERFRLRGRRVRWKVEQEEEAKEWEPIRMLKTGLREFERKSQSNDIFGNFGGSDFMEKVKLSLKSICWDPQESKLLFSCLTHGSPERIGSDRFSRIGANQGESDARFVLRRIGLLDSPEKPTPSAGTLAIPHPRIDESGRCARFGADHGLSDPLRIAAPANHGLTEPCNTC